ncbi:baseplate J/gp47 family protein [Geosporobacter ferrireducens]|uniref:baseplate J/gp47 family protein n=1 Tax=Geosporobacter ferrireducens TaxID=1424294 RepID=UPI0009F5F9D6|nr:baseplate J/gp47 family protein [Geosporobacter ferrireducens]
MIADQKTILNRMLGNIQGQFDKTEGSFFYDALAPMAIELETVHQSISSVKEKLRVEKLTGQELEQFIFERTGIKRKPATKARGHVTIKGTAGARVQENSIVASETVHFIVKETKILGQNGQAEVLVECQAYGVIGNVPAGMIRYFPMTLPGLVSVTNHEDFTSGYEEEGDQELLARYFERIQTPITSGNKYHYRDWAKEVTGVGDVKVVPLWNGDNTVKIIIIDANKQPADAELIAQVQEYIDPGMEGLGEGKAPIGAYCTVVGAVGKSLDITFKAVKDTAVTDAERSENIRKNIEQYIKQAAFKESIISYNRIGSIILDSRGIVDFIGLKINGQTGNIAIAEDEVAVLGVIHIEE